MTNKTSNRTPYSAILDSLLSGVGVAIDGPSSEEGGILESLAAKVARKLETPMFYWSITTGFRKVAWTEGVGVNLIEPPELANRDISEEPHEPHPVEALKLIGEWASGPAPLPGIFVFLDLDQFLATPQRITIMRTLKDTLTILRGCPKTKFISIGQEFELPSDLIGRMVKIKIPLPNEAERLQEIQDWVQVIRAGDRQVTVPRADDPIWKRLVTDSATLTRQEIGNIMRRVSARHKVVGEQTALAFHEAKVEKLEETGIAIEEPPKTQLGGLTLFRDWLEQKSDYFNLGNPNVPKPRGCVLVGPPGTGKTLAALIAAKVLGVPLFKLTPDLFLDKYVGGSEEKTRKLFEALEAAAPGVVLIDELEKAMSMAISGSSDGGAGTRVFGLFLNFIEKTEQPLFFIGTANNVSGLPAELFRPGRFDRVFRVGLPNQRDRVEILANHLKTWGFKMNAQDIAEIAETLAIATGGFVGSELALIVQESAQTAYSEGRIGELKLADMQRHKSSIIPQSEARKRDFEIMEEASKQFYPASEMEASPREIGMSMGRIPLPDLD